MEGSSDLERFKKLKVAEKTAEFNELKKISPVNGLSETGISAIGWSGEYNILIVAYNITNLDLIRKNSVFNIPDIMNKNIPGNKRINRIQETGKIRISGNRFRNSSC